MDRQWRFLLLEETYADFSISTSPALERGVMESTSPATVVLDVFPEDSFTVGVLDDPEKAIDLDFCWQKGIIVRRPNPARSKTGSKNSTTAPGVEISGTTAQDFVAAVVGAVEKAS